MAKIPVTIRFERSVYNEMKERAEKLGSTLTHEVNRACTKILQEEVHHDLDKIYSPILERHLEKHLKSFEERMAALMAKNALDSATTLFLLLEQVAKSRNVSVEELYRKHRTMGVKHVQKREELVKMVQEHVKKEG